MVFSQSDVTGNGIAKVLNSTVGADNGLTKNFRQSRLAISSQNKKSCKATRKPTQMQHILFCPTAPYRQLY